MRHVSGMRTRWASTAALAVVTLTVTGLSATPAESAPDASCPTPYPEASLAKGQPVTGLTVDGVDSATDPAPFTGTVLGVLRDGIAPGLDMVLVRLSSPEIDRVGGIWEGMSGSPVYAQNGDLIGAVAYGLSSGPSPVAGLTPAAEMESLLDQAPAAASAPTGRVAVPPRVARTVVAATDVTRQQLADGFTRLRLPFAVSGMAGPKRLRTAGRWLGNRNVDTMAAGAAGPESQTTPIVPGGNLAASVSYGDVTAAAIGTVTAVCGTEVLAFGHPMNDTGPATLTMHGAETLYVQEDPAAPFKVANITAPVGTVTGDRLAGLHGVLGATPATAQVTSYVESAGRSRSGSTWISVPAEVPDLAAMHLLADQDRVFDGMGGGSATVSWLVRGRREDGSAFQLSRTDMYVDRTDLSDATASALYDTLSELQHNGAEHVTIGSVSTRSVLDRTYSRYTVDQAQVRLAGRWVSVHAHELVPARAGTALRLRVRLTSAALPDRWVHVAVRVPPRAAGKLGTLQVRGGGAVAGLAGVPAGRQATAGFDAVLRRLRRAPHHNDVVAALSVFPRRGPALTRTATSGAPHVVGGRITLQVVGFR